MTVSADNSRRLSVIIQDLERGGTELQMLELLPRLMQRGWRVTLYTLVSAKGLSDNFRAAGVPVVGPRRLSWLPVRWQRLAQIIVTCILLAIRFRFRSPGLLVGVLPAGSIAAGLIGHFCGACYVVLRRSRNHYQEKRPYLTYLERFLCRRAAAAAGNSSAVAADLLAEGVSAERVAHIPNGVDVRRFAEDRAAARRALQIGDDGLVLLCLANLIVYKGHADLLSALEAARHKMPAGWTLLLAGRDDGIGVELKEQAARAGIADNVRFLGARTDVPALLAAADIGVLASHEEGFSNSVLEGMAAGLPMVVTDVGGNAEAVGQGSAGLIVPPRDIRALADAITVLANDLTLRRRLGNTARLRVAEHYSFEASVEAISCLFAVILLRGDCSQDVH